MVRKAMILHSTDFMSLALEATSATCHGKTFTIVGETKLFVERNINKLNSTKGKIERDEKENNSVNKIEYFILHF